MEEKNEFHLVNNFSVHLIIAFIYLNNLRGYRLVGSGYHLQLEGISLGRWRSWVQIPLAPL